MLLTALPTNALDPIIDKPAGRLILLRALHQPKEYCPRTVRLAGRVTLVRW